MDITVTHTNDLEPITTLSAFIGKVITVAEKNGVRAYTGLLEFVALEDTGSSYSETSTLLFSFRGASKPVGFNFHHREDESDYFITVKVI